jgi:hypothetical protein
VGVDRAGAQGSYRSLVGTDCAVVWFDEAAAALIVAGLAEEVPLPTDAEQRAYRARRGERELVAKFEIDEAGVRAGDGVEVRLQSIG